MQIYHPLGKYRLSARSFFNVMFNATQYHRLRIQYFVPLKRMFSL